MKMIHQMISVITKQLKSSKECGFTFVELIIVLAIIAGVVVFGLNILGGSSTKNLKSTGMQLFKIINYVYNEASLTGSYYRIVFDLDKQRYFVEYSSTPFYVIREEDEVEQIRIKNEEKFSGNEDEDEEEEVESLAAAVGDFSESDDDLLEIFELPENIKFADIQIFHQAERASSGRVYLYFFPKGYTEFAVIHLSDMDEEDFLSLVVNPLTAAVDIFDELVEYDEALESLKGK